MLTFLSPWWAIAMAGAIGLPLLAHLLSRKGGRPVVFPAVRFVQRASADVSRRLRPRHWLLLLLRTTMLAMVVLAFMQPVWRSTVTSTEAAQQEEAGVMAAILIDRSASMQRVERGASLYDEARRQARQMLAGLDPTRDRAAIVLVDRQPRSLMPEPSANFTQLTRLLDSTPVSHERGRLDDALRLAASLGDRSRPVHIEVFTDAQATSSSTDLLDDVERLGGRVRIHQVGREAGNVALSRPALLPARPVAGQPATLSVDVANHSSEHRSITVEVSGAARTQRQTVTIEPFTTSRASFHLAFDRIGKTVVDAAIVSSERERGVPNDALAVDNQTGLLVEVAAARPVTLVTRSAVTDPASAAWFVARALVPAADEGGGDTGTGDGGSGIALSVASPADLPRLVTEPSQADLPAVLVVAEAGSVDGEGRGAMRRHLEGGGGVIWVVDSAAAADALRSFTGAPIVPAASSAWSTGEPRSLGAGYFDDPALRIFEGPSRSALLRQTFTGSLRGAVAPGDVQPLLTFEGGEPAVAARWLGRGRLTVIGADLSPASTGLVKTPLLVPLLHELIRHSAPGEPSPVNSHPGDVLALQPGAGQSLRGPDGRVVAAPYVAGRPGPYAVMEDTTGTLVAGTWVELDPAESDLRIVEWADVSVAGEAADGRSAPMPAASPPPTVRQTTVELWPYAALAALLLAAAEAAALWRMSRAESAAGSAGISTGGPRAGLAG